MVGQRAGFGRGFPFVGRRHELGLLLDAIRHPPAVIVVEGDAGMGKSRLVHEATTTLRANGWRVVTGFCHPLREPLQYGPVVDALGKAGPWLADTDLPRQRAHWPRCCPISPVCCHRHLPRRTIRVRHAIS
ncbi:ATP-binding protein [Lentzea sp. NPDC005914]|uniref:ATP-binding protein n=1 Tax=Lentzea sp. NPDC005914 TaxID=3154572 RepID=UPI0033F6B75B